VEGRGEESPKPHQEEGGVFRWVTPLHEGRGKILDYKKKKRKLRRWEGVKDPGQEGGKK